MEPKNLNKMADLIMNHPNREVLLALGNICKRICKLQRLTEERDIDQVETEDEIQYLYDEYWDEVIKTYTSEMTINMVLPFRIAWEELFTTDSGLEIIKRKTTIIPA